MTEDTEANQSKPLSEELEDTRNELKRMADEIRVKLHLAGMDAKDAWNELQPQIEEFEQKFDVKAEEIGDELKALGGDIRSRLSKILKKDHFGLTRGAVELPFASVSEGVRSVFD